MQQALEIIKTPLLQASLWKEPLFFAAEELSPEDKEYLYEHFFCSESFQNALEGQGFLIDSSAEILVMVNIEDHLQFQLVDYSGDYQKAWARLSNLEEELGQTLNYAFSERFGYLTSLPTQSGTGLHVHALLHVAALVHTQQLKNALNTIKDDTVTITELLGNEEEHLADYLLLSNRYCLGIDERKIINTVYSFAIKLMEAEKTARTHLSKLESTHLKNLVSRAYGLLAHSYQLEAKETLGALSLIKLGIDLNWISGISDSKLNELLLLCRRGHLLLHSHLNDLDAEEVNKKRAELMQGELKAIALYHL